MTVVINLIGTRKGKKKDARTQIVVFDMNGGQFSFSFTLWTRIIYHFYYCLLLLLFDYDCRILNIYNIYK